MNVIELLMAEHASLRLHFQFARKTENWDAIYQIEEFVRSCHAKVEDEVVFPKLRDLLNADPRKQETILKDLSRLEADHRLIDKIGEQIRERTVVGGDSNTLRKRILLYATTVESHNSGEESLIFPSWKSTEESDLVVGEHVLKIIQEFGLNRYFELTGISQKFLETLSS